MYHHPCLCQKFALIFVVNLIIAWAIGYKLIVLVVIMIMINMAVAITNISTSMGGGYCVMVRIQLSLFYFFMNVSPQKGADPKE